MAHTKLTYYVFLKSNNYCNEENESSCMNCVNIEALDFPFPLYEKKLGKSHG